MNSAPTWLIKTGRFCSGLGLLSGKNGTYSSQMDKPRFNPSKNAAGYCSGFACSK